MEAPIRKMDRWKWVSPKVFGVTVMEPPRARSVDTLSMRITERSDGSRPPWVEERSGKPAAQQFVEWFNGIWQSGDTNGWNAAAFTADAVAIDPWGVSEGPQEAAATLLRLLRHFPELRGEVTAWAANGDELFVDWRLRLRRDPDRPPLLTTVADRFRFDDGRISFRQSNFDIVNVTTYLAEAGHRGEIYEFFAESLDQRTAEGAPRIVPRTLRAAFVEFWRWRVPEDRSGLRVIPGDGGVTLEWRRRDGAASYGVYRATNLSGPYDLAAEVETNRYVDSPLDNGTAYWYVVEPRMRRVKFVSVRRSRESVGGRR
jgi:hypothetical protein